MLPAVALSLWLPTAAAAPHPAPLTGPAGPDESARAAAELSDDDIAAALEHELLAAKHVPGNLIDVDVADGIVTLGGRVTNLLAAERAVRIAKMVKGVRAVVDRIDVQTLVVADERLAGDVHAALVTDPATDSWEIDVQARDGTVVLSGQVSSRAEAELAEMVAKGVAGVRAVRDEMLVVYANDRTDAEILAEVRQSLAWDARIDDQLLKTEVEDGVVTLSGFVGSAQEKTMARSRAWVSGVQDVDSDRLEVQWWAADPMLRGERWHSLGDDGIRDAVLAALDRDPRVQAFDPQVEVERGVVTLRGEVDNVKARRAAARDAQNTVGVWRVENLLRVRPVIATPDDQVAGAIRAALARSPFVDAGDIDVEVKAGIARLDGEVPAYFTRELVEDLTARVNGVTEIDNALDVDYDLPRSAITALDWGPVRFDHDFDYHVVRTRADEDIRDDVASELFWSPFVDESRIDVSVTSGVATLTGEVGTWRERRLATDNALEGGALKVVNELDVTPPSSSAGSL